MFAITDEPRASATGSTQKSNRIHNSSPSYALGSLSNMTPPENLTDNQTEEEIAMQKPTLFARVSRRFRRARARGAAARKKAGRGGIVGAVEGRRSRTARGMAYGFIIALLSILFLDGRSIVTNWGDSLRDNWIVLRSVVSQEEEEVYSGIGVLGNVSLIEIDRATRQSWNGRTFNARDVGQLLLQLKRNGVRAVMLDLPDINGAFMDAQEQKKLARDIAQSGIVYLPIPHSAPNEYVNSAQKKRFAALSRGAAGVGHTALWLDSDGHVRRTPLQSRIGGTSRLSLSLACALGGLGLQGRDAQPLDDDGIATSWKEATHLRMGGRAFSISPGGLLLLNYTPPLPLQMRDDAQSGASIDESSTRNVPQAPIFPTLSLQDALRNPQKTATWRDRCVVIGVSDSAVASQFLLPNGARVPEMMIHAIALDNLLSGTTLVIVPQLFLWLMTLLLTLAVGGIVASRPPTWSALVTFLGLLAVFILSLGSFIQDIWLDPTLPLLAVSLAWLQGVIWRARVQERETTRVAAAVETLERTGEIVSQRSPAGDLLPRVLQWLVASSEAESASALLLLLQSDSATATDSSQPQSPITTSVEAEQWHEVAPQYQRKRGVDALPAGVRSAVFAHVQRSGERLLVRDVRRDTRFWPRERSFVSFESSLNVLSVMAAPLRVGGVQSGALLVVNGHDGAPFSVADLELLEAVANQASVALDNARLYDILNRRIKRSESELESANRDLQAEKNTLQAVLESMTDGVVVTDDKGNVQIVNPAARALMPELERCHDQSLAECLPDVASALASSMMTPEGENPDHLDATSSTRTNARTNIQNNARAKNPYNANTLFTSVLIERGDKDAPRLIEARSAPLQSAAQSANDHFPDVAQARGLVAVFADVTQERAAQQAKSDFVSFVAHEMRSPLTSISGFSSMLSRMEQGTQTPGISSTRSDENRRDGNRSETNRSNVKNDPNDAKQSTRARYLQVIFNESERLTRLINNLLDVARIEAGHALELQAQPLDFGTVAREAIESQRLYSSRHTLVDQVPRDLPQVLIDRDKTLQILINLLSNANKYSPGGNVTVSARVRDNGLEGDHLEVRVRDEGPGIAPELQSRLFQRFGTLGSKGEAATNLGVGERAKPTGTGLGLFLTRYLVELQGGRIRIESEPGHGATFIFTLPLWKGETP